MMRVFWLASALLPAVAAGTPDEPGGARGGRHALRIEVVDADTGGPLACRVSVRGEDGAWHFAESESPEGSAVRYEKRSGGDAGVAEVHTTVSAHPFVLDLAPGRYEVTVERGKEYHPETYSVVVGDRPVELTIRLRRWIDLAARGWYSGETHVHRTLDELPNAMCAEDLNVAFPLLDWVREASVAPTDRRDDTFPSAWPALIRFDDARAIFPRNTEYEIFTVDGRPHTLGAFFVINHRTPLDLGVPPVGPVGRRAHAEGALIELDKHSWPWSMALVPVLPVDLFELSNNHVWRAGFGFPSFGEPPADFMEIERDGRGFTERGWIEFGFRNYYALLNCGFRLRPTAGTASGVHPVPLGFGRVYVRLPDGFDPEAWLRGLDAGRSFVTTGPMLFVTLDGREPGDRFEPPESDRRAYRLAGSAVSGSPLDRIEVVVNGEVARTIAPENRATDRGAFESGIDATLEIEGSSWVAVRCFEDRPDGRPRFAHTAPVHIDVPGRPLRPRREEVDYLVRRVEEQIGRSEGVLPDAALDEYRRALAIYRAIAEGAR